MAKTNIREKKCILDSRHLWTSVAVCEGFRKVWQKVRWEPAQVQQRAGLRVRTLEDQLLDSACETARHDFVPARLLLQEIDRLLSAFVRSRWYSNRSFKSTWLYGTQWQLGGSKVQVWKECMGGTEQLNMCQVAQRNVDGLPELPLARWEDMSCWSTTAPLFWQRPTVETSEQIPMSKITGRNNVTMSDMTHLKFAASLSSAASSPQYYESNHHQHH